MRLNDGIPIVNLTISCLAYMPSLREIVCVVYITETSCKGKCNYWFFFTFFVRLTAILG